MGVLADAFVRVTVDSSQLGAGLGAIHNRLGTLSSVTARLEGQMLRAFGSAAVGALAYGLYKSVTAASHLDEVLNKVGVIFKTNSADVIRAADEMSNRFGISKSAFLDGAAALGSMGKQIGMTEKSSADFGVGITKLAADFSSLHDIPLQESLRVLQGGLSGMVAPLRHYGIAVYQALVKQEAYATGLAKAGTPLSEQAKLQARLAIIMRGTADAQGDLERTQGSFANQLRRLSGIAENTAIAMGRRLNPALNMVVQRLGTFAHSFEDALKDPESQISIVVDWFIKLGTLVAEFGATAGKVIGTAIENVSKFSGPLAEIGISFENITSLVKTFGDNANAVFALTMIDFQELIGQIGADFTYIGGLITALMDVFTADWKDGLMLMGELTLKFLENIGKNLIDFGKSAWQWMTGGFQGGFDFKPTVLYEGMGDLAKEHGAKLPEREKVDMTDARNDILNKIAENTAEALKKKEDKPLSDAASHLQNLEFEREDAVAPKKKKKKEDKAAFIGIAEFARTVQAGFGDKSKVHDEQLSTQKSMLAKHIEMAANIAKIADDGLMGVGLAVA